uniref:Uncharacterized protein n=1 Tax=Arundo donax TaxID=35708 RepID=A0A0A8ZKE5_ARUDO
MSRSMLKMVHLYVNCWIILAWRANMHFGL